LPDVAIDRPAFEKPGERVGYEDAAFFRRLFKRTTGITPGAYRRRFQIPEFARG
jgi:transcriptional regulator GlxA family with amidase domain